MAQPAGLDAADRPNAGNSVTNESTEAQGTHAAKASSSETEAALATGNIGTDINGHGDIDSPHADQMFQLVVKLPHHPFKIHVMVSTQEQVQDIRQSIIELPDTFQYSCFHLEHNGERINDFVELSDVPGITPDSELVLVEDPYTEKEARIHLLRVRELIGAASSRIDLMAGVNAGQTLFYNIFDELETTEASRAHSMVDYEFEAPASLLDMLPAIPQSPPKTIKTLSLSPWNPPPHSLRQRGHLLYIQVTTLEGEQFHITSHVSGFYVNRSSSNKFDPLPKTSPRGYSAHSLLELISQLSSEFRTEFKKLHEFQSKKDPLITFQPTNAIPASPWLVPAQSSPYFSHSADISRSQETFLIAGTESNDTLRDFNEEFQSTRELPKETVQERVFRERLLSKLFADFTDAAVRGAVLIARGEVAPLNPTEGRDAQIYVYNNIFFSYGADGVGTFAAEGGDEAARVATGKDILGVRMVNNLDITGLSTPGTVVVDYLGRRIVGQSIVPGIFKQREPGETQIDYGGVEGKDVIASNEIFVPAFEQLSKAMRVKPHPVWDKEGSRHDLVASVETKGLLGTDGRKYVLDLYRTTPLDILFLEQHWENEETSTRYPHRMAVLRSELIDSMWKVKMRQYVNSDLEKKKKEAEAGVSTDNKKDKKEEQEAIDLSGLTFSLNPDVFSGQKPHTDEEKEQFAKDEEDVRQACQYLTDKVIPGLIDDLKKGDVGSPMDGYSLSRLMHKRGINIRYLGNIANLAASEGQKLLAVKVLAEQEMVARACKHHLNSLLRDLPSPLVTYCVAHYLNCLLGTGLNPDPKAEKDDLLWAVYSKGSFEFEALTPAAVQKAIEDQVFRRYRFKLAETWWTSIKHKQILREISLKMGLQLCAKEYAFDKTAALTPPPPPTTTPSTQPTTNGQSKQSSKKKGGQAQPNATTAPTAQQQLTFTQEDIVNIVAIVKEASPKSQLAEEALEAGRISILQDQRELGQELLLESLSLHEQIYGILHPEVARVYNALAMIYYQLDEKPAAVELSRKAVLVAERILGVDSAETILSYLNLALFEHASGNTNAALALIRHALKMWKIVYGEGHPDSVTTMNNTAVMLQALKHYHDSRLWFEASLKLCESIFGASSPNTATLSFQLAQALALDNESKGAVSRMRDAYNVFLQEFGADDRNTKEAENWLEQLTQNAVSIAKQAKDLQNRRLRRVAMTPRVTLGTKPQPGLGLSAADSIKPEDPISREGIDSRSIDDLMRYIEGTDTKKTPGSKKQPGRANPKRRGGKA
ncbi:Intracellular distribution of mitochondria [Orbilia oligospora]|uniref:Clustered mitochondria protein homolog n=1 Tax=Orbilia oligospora TaxID=2813651 RepID=A0A7C8PDG1_ORBOL|nr:Intracellular distribution of mitochondria [Orbilia oligospora]KAF3196695.1 Intracellular distribution of mitochondria [Orbilia oligospora]KAF3198126.1 Intracellular distribution of mitochondria [Orbilia oligospora]